MPRTASGRIGASRTRPGGRARRPPFSVKRLLLLLLKTVVIIHLVYMFITSFCIIAYKFTDPAYTVLMPYRSIGYGWKLTKPLPLPLEKIPLYLRSMLVAVEDGKFYTHHGIDMEAFRRAKEINDRLGKPLYGGSTLTMQVARTLFLVPEKSYIRKYFEVIAALELELFLTKERILELYFGYAEWGKGIFGIEAASRHYYGRGVASLTRDQAARLIALLSSPIKYTPSTLDKSAILRERYAYLLRRYVTPAAVSPDNAELIAPPPGDVEAGFEERADEGGLDGAAVLEGSTESEAGTTESDPAQAGEPGGGALIPDDTEIPDETLLPAETTDALGFPGSVIPEN